MLTFRQADMADVHAVFRDLSPISAAEVSKECGTWWKALPRVQELLALPDSQTEALVDENGRALAIFGHYPSTTSVIRTTWFVFSKGFMVRGVAATRACQRRLEALRTFYPAIDFHTFTASDHWQRTRWFAMLGFHYLGMSDDEHHYVLLPHDVYKDSDLAPPGRYKPTNPRAS